MLDASDVHVIFYEHLVDEPERELASLRGYLERIGPGRWDLRSVSNETLLRPSQTNRRGTDVSTGSRRLGDWQRDVPTDRIERALSLVGTFGLDRLYGESPWPLLTADKVLLGGSRVRSVSRPEPVPVDQA